ncbi:TadE/TadG family type IV pilus assembly protein [Dendrosporobacter sp. 1207_IL3150]|uniref:TadE/TadG family type IV pilus assembly protein n=1 Tax=Dendrosporobacter sp. 1207_IL3150 TaxID=3084054 RepID=UPI002FD9EA6C
MLKRIMGYLRNNRGQGLVEMGLIMPVFLLLALGIMEFSLIIHQYTIVNQTAREGARSAALGGSDATVFATVKDAVPTAIVSKDKLQIVISPAARTRGEAVTVTVKHPLQPITPLIGAFFTQIPNVEGSATMRVE